MIGGEIKIVLCAAQFVGFVGGFDVEIKIAARFAERNFPDFAATNFLETAAVHACENNYLRERLDDFGDVLADDFADRNFKLDFAGEFFDAFGKARPRRNVG